MIIPVLYKNNDSIFDKNGIKNFIRERSISLMIKGLIKTLSYIQLLLGIIRSFIIAYSKGKVSGYSRHYERSIGITIGWFLVSMLSVLILFLFYIHCTQY